MGAPHQTFTVVFDTGQGDPFGIQGGPLMSTDGCRFQLKGMKWPIPQMSINIFMI